MLLSDGCGYFNATRSGFGECCWLMAVATVMPPFPAGLETTEYETVLSIRNNELCLLQIIAYISLKIPKG